MIYRRKTPSSSTGANNDTNFLYFSSIPSIEANNNFISTLNNSSINTHTDRIIFNCYSDIKDPYKLLFKALNDHNYISKKDKLIKRDIYKRRRVYIHSDKEIKITILYKRKHSCPSYYPHFRIILDNPDLSTIDWFDVICNSFGFTTKLSYVELAIDYSPFDYFFKEYLCCNMFLKHHRGTCCVVGGEFGSFYIGNKSKNSKSVILYSKEIDNDKVLRKEFRLNRAFLKRIELELDCFEKINDIDLSRLVSFKQLNREKLLKHLIWKNRLKLSEYNDDDKSLLIRQLGHIPSTANIVMDQISCMKIIPYINNSQRFFEDMAEVNNAFFRRLNGTKFI